MPRQSLPEIVAQKFTHLALADPSFATPSPIDLLLGADIFSSALNGKRVEVGNVYPVAFGSIFGWILIGPVPSNAMSAFHAIPVSLTTSIESLMDRFWHVEEPDAAPETFTVDGKCEAIFRNECSRDPEGRFTVPLPFREKVTSDAFHGSRAIALKRFENLERKLHADPRLRDMYVQFMSEYISLGHMTVAAAPGRYFIPHHAVYRSSVPSSKIRVVFDASAASSTGTSLNNCLLTGPKLQQDVVDILLLFRLSRYAFTTDVCKMYRQILVNPEYRPFQHIFWRDSPFAELKEYELNTVTYGVNCAPYLAMRVIKSVAEQDCKDCPAVQYALLKQTYVDDICTGADSEKEVLELQSSIISIMAGAGFELKKWSSNNREVLDCVAPEDRATGSTSFDGNDVSGVKVLGLQWDHREDSFNYAFQLESVVQTKRGMLSLIAQIFDPLGFLAPTIFAAKHLMQRVWSSHVSWDETLPDDLAELWRNFVADLHILSDLKVPRFIGTRLRSRCILCGFCDASEKGYAAVVYIRLEDTNDQRSVVLLGSKTKLAPMKSVTIPRLELCAAVLLSKWLHRIQLTLSVRLNITHTFAWSDSSIVLSWLTAPHQSFKIFVSNRVHKIQSLLPTSRWLHIGSSDNPADCASRGLTPSELLNHQLYWEGPRCLHSPIETWSTDFHAVPVDQLPELRVTQTVLTTIEPESEWFNRFSSYTQMIRVVARVKRFIYCCRHGRPLVQNSWLSRSDLDAAIVTITRSAQQFAFPALHRELSVNSEVSNSVLARLRPFINEKGLICVGGRLRYSDLPEAQKFPMLLPKSSHLSMLIVRHWHQVTFHSGPRVLTSIIAREFWILSLRSLIRSVISKCTRCVRIAAVHPQPVMADLPRSRVSECRPFSRVGIDFAGPLKMTENRLRKSREYKVYIAVFVCFVVKAVHLEVVSDLSTKAFLAALDRFVARRGIPTDIYTDCGTNFVGAARQLNDLINDVANRDHISASVRTTWHFNPPSAPHFGGLWEAAVRSTKSLMVKVMGEHTFTLEEFTTIICRIEAILNSRPLTPTSTDPSDLDCLTPGHFLIGQPLLTIPTSEDNGSICRLSIANRWKLLHQCVQAFWKRWRDEYLQTLQCRHRWSSDAPSFALGDMVVIKDANSPPLTWRLGRVIELMPGLDGVVRVVRVSTQQGSMVRPVVKLVLLPATQ
ncbi:PREDICTED: uncharacterized protein LOC107164278 [Diuraphis noxia]|uniref:uncharacterized protein LOC107164278 n=1 Tax=Diuraphis noxia TaxID=143948 RepID=UPI000763A836|nr:PREDICTED: uncharacterized protein LOC107164278 [Diuraphis noxia]